MHVYCLMFIEQNYVSHVLCVLCISNNYDANNIITDILKLKLNYRKQVFFFALNFLPWEFLFIKKLEIEKTKTTQYTTFKTDRIKVVLVFSISNFFTNKKSQGRKLSSIQLQSFSFIGAAAIVVVAVTLPSTNQKALFTENVIKSSLISLS